MPYRGGSYSQSNSPPPIQGGSGQGGRADVWGLNDDGSGQGISLQERLGLEAISETEAAQRRLEETLAPFVGFGESVIPSYNQLFAPTTAESIAASPTISGLQGMGFDAVSSNPFLSQLNPAGLDQYQLIGGIPLLSRERGDLLSAIGLGQASAAQEAAANLQTGSGRADLLSSIGDVRAAQIIANQQRQAQNTQNLVGLGTALASYYYGGGGG